MSPGVAVAADITVTTTVDGDDKECALDCTLREAVSLAGSSDRVILPGGSYRLTMGELCLTSDTIVGAGARTTAIDGGGSSRVLYVTGGTTKVSGVSILRGTGESERAPGLGGGVFVQSGTLQLTNSTVRGNTAERGGGIATAGTALLIGTTVSGNAASFVRPTRGGGIWSSGALGMLNSTVSGNTATDPSGASLGGGVSSTGQLSIHYTTIAGNTAASGGFHVVQPQSGVLSILSSVLAGGSGDACSGAGIAALTASNNVVDDASCQFKDPSNRQNVNPALGPLANNGGPTDTHALLPASAAISAAGTCTATDQRAIARPAPAGATCDAGAYEYRAPTLKVVMAVVNDDGGTLTPSRFTVHVRTGGVDVKGSPQAGAPEGTTYVLDAGSTYAVAADPVAGYNLTASGDCAITPREGENRSCTITANDVAPPPPPVRTQQQLPPPQPGKSVNALPKSGSVMVKLPGTDTFVALDEGQQLPVGTIVDARKGRLTLIAAADRSGGTATAEFWAGIFLLGQTNGAAPITTLVLVEELECPSGKASAAAKRKTNRRLWGDGKGRFRTKGRYSSATVRGTRWLVEDRCTNTLTRVKKGRVAVRDFAKTKTVVVRAGKRYVARRRG